MSSFSLEVPLGKETHQFCSVRFVMLKNFVFESSKDFWHLFGNSESNATVRKCDLGRKGKEALGELIKFPHLFHLWSYKVWSYIFGVTSSPV